MCRNEVGDVRVLAAFAFFHRRVDRAVKPAVGDPSQVNGIRISPGLWPLVAGAGAGTARLALIRLRRAGDELRLGLILPGHIVEGVTVHLGQPHDG